MTVALGSIIHSLLRSGWRASRARKAAQARRSLGMQETKALVAEFGMSANSFMTLYPGFSYFPHPDASIRGMIAFIDASDAWVGGAEPFCAPENRESLLREFAAAAASLGKAAMMVPVNQENAETALRAGYRALMVGCEPTFKLDRYPRTGRTWNDVVPTAKSIAARGAKVTEFFPRTLDPKERAIYDEMTREWLSTRKMDALGFLNQVDPWFRAEDKRFFQVEHNGRILAFLAAIPIWARNGWYLIDLIRRGDSPAGSTELLLLHAMRILRESGAQEVTMGVSPLSNLEEAAKHSCGDPVGNRRTYSILRLIFEKGGAFYNFKPLYQYKLKFDPSYCAPAFLIYQPALKPRALLSLSRAFMPAGVVLSTYSAVIRFIGNFSLGEWIQGQLKLSTVVRSAPPTWMRLLSRCKFTVSIFVINLVTYYLTTDASGLIDPAIEKKWEFSWVALTHSPFHALALSPFLHWNPFHISANLLTLVICTGGLEYLVGSGLTALVFLVPVYLANPLVAALVRSPVETDIGASLGIFGCAGALSGFLKRGNWLLLLLSLSIVTDTLIKQSFLSLDHLVAVVIGLLIGRWLLR